jgi:hypothetical protein
MITTPKANVQPKIKPTKMMCVVKKCSTPSLEVELWSTNWKLTYTILVLLTGTRNHIIF